MLYWGEFGPPWVRSLIHVKEFEPRSEKLRDWASQVNDSKDPVLDEMFRSMAGEPGMWRRILQEEDHPQNAILDERTLEEEIVREAADRVLALIEVIRPYVEKS